LHACAARWRLAALAVRYSGAPAANAGIRAFGHHYGGRKWQSQRSGSNNRARYRESAARKETWNTSYAPAVSM